jgi:hypothetical protein
MTTMNVRYLGPSKRIYPSADADPVNRGDVLTLHKRAIARLRTHGHKFEAVDEGEKVPDPEPQEPPESHQRQSQKRTSPIEIAKN